MGGGRARSPPKGRGEHHPRRLAGARPPHGDREQEHSGGRAARTEPLQQWQSSRSADGQAAAGRGEVTCPGLLRNHWAQILTKRNHVFHKGRSTYATYGGGGGERLIPVLSCRKGMSDFPLGLEKPETGGSHTLFKTMKITPSRAADQHRHAKHSRGNTRLTQGSQEEAKDGSQSPEL